MHLTQVGTWYSGSERGESGRSEEHTARDSHVDDPPLWSPGTARTGIGVRCDIWRKRSIVDTLYCPLVHVARLARCAGGLCGASAASLPFASKRVIEISRDHGATARAGQAEAGKCTSCYSRSLSLGTRTPSARSPIRRASSVPKPVMALGANRVRCPLLSVRCPQPREADSGRLPGYSVSVCTGRYLRLRPSDRKARDGDEAAEAHDSGHAHVQRVLNDLRHHWDEAYKITYHPGEAEPCHADALTTAPSLPPRRRGRCTTRSSTTTACGPYLAWNRDLMPADGTARQTRTAPRSQRRQRVTSVPAVAEHPLRRARLRRGMTQVELAGLAGLSCSYISMVERGQRKLTRRDHVNALAAVLRVLAGRDRAERDSGV